MSKQVYTSLHNHSDFSILKSALTIKELLQQAQTQGHKAVALTDYHSLAGIPEFCATANTMDIKPIIGCELTIDLSKALRQFSLPEQLQNKTLLDRLLVYCENEAGYHNLCELLSASTEYTGAADEWNTPIIGDPPLKERVISIQSLENHKEGMLFVYGGMRSRLFTDMLENRLEPQDCLDLYLGLYSGALQTSKQQSLEHPNLFLNIQYHDRPEETELNRIVVKYAQSNSIAMLASVDVHYSQKEDHHRLLQMECIRTSHAENDETLLSHPGNEYYFHSNEEMQELFSDLPEALENSNRIADRCNFTLNMDRYSELWPVFPFPNGQDNGQDHGKDSPIEFLRQLVFERLPDRYPNPSAQVLDRVNYELDIVEQLQYANYLLFVQDFINFAREKGFPTSPGRGATAGSILCYILGITEVCPIDYGLHFERFLNPERVFLNTIVTEFSDEGRESVKYYLLEKYGKDHMSLLSHYIRFNGKAHPELKGLIKSKDVHTAGFLLSSTKLQSLIPLDHQQKLSCTEYEQTYIENLGVLKLDILSLPELSVAEKCIQAIEQNFGDTIDFHSTPTDDPQIFDLFVRGDTDRIFLFRSLGIREYLKQLQPKSFIELANLNTMYRPGLLDDIPEYIRRNSVSAEEKKQLCFHEHLEPILLETNGLILYQEQFMSILQTIAGYSLGKANLVRRELAKKVPTAMTTLYSEFKKESTNRGYSAKLIEELWDKLLSSVFTFNKSHIVPYTLISFRCAWLKTHYPEEFLAAYEEVERGKIVP